MQRFFTGILLLITVSLGAGCASSPPSTAVLPTATHAPVLAQPTPTPTFLPPPTVTPFPTATPGGRLATQPPSDLSGAEDGELPASGTPEAGEGLQAEPSPTLIVSPTSSSRLQTPVERDSLLFTSGFDRGWPSIEEENARIATQNGEYVFEIGPNALRYLTTTSVNAADMFVQVQATPAECPASGGYGLFFRLVNADNYYSLTFFCDNRVTVFARSGGALIGEPLVSTTLPSSLSAADPSPHTLGVLAQGSNFTLYFDELAVADFSSDLHARGDIALYAVSPPDSVLRVAFDNLEVWTVR